MSKRDDSAVVQDMLESLTRIIEYTENIDYSTFENDKKTQDAVIRNIEILGEAAKLLSAEARSKYSDIPWKDIAGTRDKLIHDYFGVNIDIVWDIVKNEAPVLFSKLSSGKS
jgi:uncharacterized protein with HEPN domain